MNNGLVEGIGLAQQPHGQEQDQQQQHETMRNNTKQHETTIHRRDMQEG